VCHAFVLVFVTQKNTTANDAFSDDGDTAYNVTSGGQPEGVQVERLVAVCRLVRVSREFAKRRIYPHIS